jgi:pyrroloquinoline quinone (PQQ) biosynthesis protein C
MIEERAREWDCTTDELRNVMREELIRARDLGHDAYWRDYSERHGVPLEICLDPDRFNDHVDQQLAEYQAWVQARKAGILAGQEWWQAGRHYIGGMLQD